MPERRDSKRSRCSDRVWRAWFYMPVYRDVCTFCVCVCVCVCMCVRSELKKQEGEPNSCLALGDDGPSVMRLLQDTGALHTHTKPFIPALPYHYCACTAAEPMWAIAQRMREERELEAQFVANSDHLFLLFFSFHCPSPSFQHTHTHTYTHTHTH